MKHHSSSFFLLPSSFKEFQNGFTILELLVASLLLSMLVTIMTMVFNQSSISWRTGVAGVVELGETRMQLGVLHDVEDDALPGLGQSGKVVDNRDVAYRTVSMFRKWSGSGAPTAPGTGGRLYDTINWQTAPQQGTTAGNALNGGYFSIGGGSSRGGDAYAVGVRSSGPDRKFGTPDDISTFPEEVK